MYRKPKSKSHHVSCLFKNFSVGSIWRIVSVCILIILAAWVSKAKNVSSSENLKAMLMVDGHCPDANLDDLCDDGITYKTIQAAIHAASAGDTIQVAAATYTETVRVTKALHIIGDPGGLSVAGPGPDAPVIEGNGTAGYGFRIASGVDNVTIEGFMIRNFGLPAEVGGGQSAGVGVHNTTTDPMTAITIRHNRFEGINWASVFFFNEGQNTYENVDVSYNVIRMGTWALNTNVYGIECTNCTHSILAHNIISGGYAGMLVTAQEMPGYTVVARHNSVVNNVISGSAFANIQIVSFDPTWGQGTAMMENIHILNNNLSNDGNTSSQGNRAVVAYPYGLSAMQSITISDNAVNLTNADDFVVEVAAIEQVSVLRNTFVVTPTASSSLLYLDDILGIANVTDNQFTLDGTPAWRAFYVVDIDRGGTGALVDRMDNVAQTSPRPIDIQLLQRFVSDDRPKLSLPPAPIYRTYPHSDVCRFEIRGNDISEQSAASFSTGIRLRPTLDENAIVSIRDNTIQGFYRAVHANAPLNLTLRGNHLSQNQYGIDTTGTMNRLGFIASNNVISGNTQTGLLLAGAHPLTAEIGGSLARSNNFRNNGTNISVTLPFTTPPLVVTYNNWGYVDIADIETSLYHQPDNANIAELIYYTLTVAASPIKIVEDNALVRVTGTLEGLYHPAGTVISFTSNLTHTEAITAITDLSGQAWVTMTIRDATMITATTGMAANNPQVATVRIHSGSIYLPIVMRLYDFNAFPYIPTSPSPTDGAFNICPTVMLSWLSGDPDHDPVTYDVYLDKAQPPQTLIRDEQTLVCEDVEASLCTAGSLDLETRYIWQVVATDAYSHVTLGPIWSFTTTAILPDPTWQEVGTGSAQNGGVSHNSGASEYSVIAVAPDRSLYVAWQDESSGNTEIYIRHWNGLTWDEVGPESATNGGLSRNSGNSRHPDLAVSVDGTLYAAWQDNTSGNDEIYILRWRDGEWQELGPGSATGGGVSNNPGSSQHPALAIAPDGSLYVTWQDNSRGYDDIYARRWDGTTWHDVGLGSSSGGGISNNLDSSQYPDIAISADNVPYIVWHNRYEGDTEIYVRRWNGDTWEEVGFASARLEGISHTEANSWAPQLAMSATGTPYVAWHDHSSGNAEIYIRRWNGSTWEVVGAGSASGSGISQTSKDSKHPSLVVVDEQAYVAWYDWSSGDAEIYIRHWNGSEWQDMGTDSSSGGGISNNVGDSQYPMLAKDVNGSIYIVWHDQSSGNREIYALRWFACQ